MIKNSVLTLALWRLIIIVILSPCLAAPIKLDIFTNAINIKNRNLSNRTKYLKYIIMPNIYSDNGLMFIMIKRTLCALTAFAISSGALASVAVPDFSVPEQGQQVILNIPQLRLFLFQDGKLIKTYPIAVGKIRTQTPIGQFKIGAKISHPTWSVPVSIQREMAAKGKAVTKSVPPGPKTRIRYSWH